MPICQIYGLRRDLLQCLLYIKQHKCGVVLRNNGGTLDAHKYLSLLLKNNLPPLPPNLFPMPNFYLAKLLCDLGEKLGFSLLLFPARKTDGPIYHLVDACTILLLSLSLLCLLYCTNEDRNQIKKACFCQCSQQLWLRTQGACRFGKTALLPAVPLLIVKNSHVRVQNFKECGSKFGDLCCSHLFGDSGDRWSSWCCQFCMV